MIPELLVRNAREYWPELSDSWLAALPALIDDICAQWELTRDNPGRALDVANLLEPRLP